MRQHVHLVLTSDQLAERDVQMTVSVNADSDQDAQEFVMDLLQDIEFDITEIEEA